MSILEQVRQNQGRPQLVNVEPGLADMLNQPSRGLKTYGGGRWISEPEWSMGGGDTPDSVDMRSATWELLDYLGVDPKDREELAKIIDLSRQQPIQPQKQATNNQPFEQERLRLEKDFQELGNSGRPTPIR